MKLRKKKLSLLLVVCLLVGMVTNGMPVEKGTAKVKKEAVKIPTVCYLDQAPAATPVIDPSDTLRYSIRIKAKKDGEVWGESGTEFALHSQTAPIDQWTIHTDANTSDDSTEDGIIEVQNGYYDIFEVLEKDADGYATQYVDTGKDTIVSSSFVSDSAEIRDIYVDYYTVSFYDGTTKMTTPEEEVVIEGESMHEPLTAPQKENYEFVKWTTGMDSDTEFDFEHTAITGTTSIYAQWNQLDANYKEEYYLQNVEDDEYPDEPTSSEMIEGNAGEKATVTDKEFPGFTIVSVEEGKLPSINADGSTVVKYYYTRNKYSLTWNANGGTIQDATYTTGEVKYGATIQAPSNVTRDRYIYEGWDATVDSTMPANDLEYTAQWSVEPTPTPTPTAIPTAMPTPTPTAVPTPTSTAIPTVAPTAEPTVTTTMEPAVAPTVAPTAEPTVAPTVKPTTKKKKSPQTISVMRAQVIPKKNQTQKLEWQKVKNADGYIIYHAHCSFKLKKLTTIKSGDVTSFVKKNCKEDEFYKYRVKAYKLVKGKKKIIAKSWVCHAICVDEDSKYTNVGDVKVKNNTLTCKTGKTIKLNAKNVTFVKEMKGKILASEKHCARIRYVSTNKKVAKIKNGKLIAKKAGKCTLYVIAPSGKCARVKVTVTK